ncbi:MAG: hypothetical protein QF679_02135 [Candidatus Pacebacteria bacterium]|jgi:hypothetical protein|nr:hypothetical protein [Candidatus Paceibacterota bacterium]
MKKNHLKKTTSILAFTIAVFFGISANAQLPGTTADEVILSTSPQFPRSNESVSVSVKSFSYNLDNSNIAWFVDDVLVREGIASMDIDIETGNVGTRIRVSVVVSTDTGFIVREDITIYPADVDILWQADSYSPPFYRGKKLAPPDGDVEVIAMPRIANTFGSLVSSEGLIYTWTRNNKVIGSQSGKGKRVFSTKAPFGEEVDVISVKVSTPDGLVTGGRLVEVSSSEPKIVFYEEDPLLGQMFNKAIDKDFGVGEEEKQFTAYPYFFSVDGRNSRDLDFSWQVNGREIENLDEDRGSLVVANEGGGSGSSILSLDIRNLVRIFQSASAGFSINF